MEPTRIVMMDLDPHSCPEDHGGQLTKLLRNCTFTSAVAIQVVTHLPSETRCPPPDLIVLRPACPANLSELGQCLRSRWDSTPIVGLFCTGMTTLAAVGQSLLDDLDDFLTCPLRDIDVFPRMQWSYGNRSSLSPLPRPQR